MELTNVNDLEEYRRRIYIRIGLFVHEWQLLEYTFAILLAITRSDKKGNANDIFIELQDKSFGFVIKEFEDTGLAPQKLIDGLKGLNEYRNGMLHKFFISYTDAELKDYNFINNLEVLMDKNTKALTELRNKVYNDILKIKLGFIEGDNKNEQV